MTASPYDDPLRARHPGAGLEHPWTYWQATAGPAPADDGVLDGDRDCDVAIIGGGYTGLSCAYHLARDAGASTVVLEANQPAWGCSGRNGSFARPAIGRLPYAQWERRWGRDGARGMFDEALAALETVREVIRDAGIDCDVQSDGWLKLAHTADQVDHLKEEQALLSDLFGFTVDFLDKGRIAAEHVNGGEAHAALRWPVSFAMHPLKLGYGLLRAARGVGAAVHAGSPALGIDKRDARHLVSTPQGTVRAREIVIATNGYTLESLFPALRGRLAPVLSNIVVTRPLSDEEIERGNFVTTDCMSDTRKLLHYYRRLPDNRIMLGGKGPLRDRTHAMQRHRAALLDVVARKFPFVGKVEAEHFWGGWVALTPDSVPHVFHAADDPSLHYALGYMGSGVSFSFHAGRRIAERIGGRPATLPAPVSRSLPRFPFAAFRRVGQAIAMRWMAFKDGG